MPSAGKAFNSMKNTFALTTPKVLASSTLSVSLRALLTSNAVDQSSWCGASTTLTLNPFTLSNQLHKLGDPTSPTSLTLPSALTFSSPTTCTETSLIPTYKVTLSSGSALAKPLYYNSFTQQIVWSGATLAGVY